jgi:hypothetical protein
MKQQGFSTFTNILLLLIIITLVGLGLFYWQEQRLASSEKEQQLLDSVKNKPQDGATTTEEPATVKPTEITEPADYTDKTVEEKPAEVKTTETPPAATTSSAGALYLGKYLTIAEGQTKITSENSSLLAQNSETIRGAIMPINPSNANKFYFGAVKTEEGKMATGKIYSYEISTGKMRELYWERYGNEIIPIGIEEGKLIVYTQKYNAAPASCFVPWLDAKVQYLDMANVTGGLNDYTVSEEVLKQARELKNSCK